MTSPVEGDLSRLAPSSYAAGCRSRWAPPAPVASGLYDHCSTEGNPYEHDVFCQIAASYPKDCHARAGGVVWVLRDHARRNLAADCHGATLMHLQTNYQRSH